MGASLKVTTFFLLSLIFQNSSCSKKSKNIPSVEQNIGQLSDVEVYEKTLAPSIKDRIFAILKDGLFYERFLKSIGADPKLSPEQLASDKKKEWDKVYLLFVDLYRIVYKALDPLLEKCDRDRKPGEKLMDRNCESIEFMEFVFNPKGNALENDEDEEEDCIVSFEQLLDAIQRHYTTPFDSYVNGGDWETFKASVNSGRVATYRAFTDLCRIMEASERNRNERR